MKEFALSWEQELDIRAFELDTKRMSREQAILGLEIVFGTMVRKEAYYKSMLADSLGIQSPSTK